MEMSNLGARTRSNGTGKSPALPRTMAPLGRVRAGWQLRSGLLLGIVLLLAFVHPPAQADSEPLGDPLHRYDEHTPSANTMQRARRAYRANRHRAAFEYYKVAAFWADKLAQYNVGVMYLQGQGVEFDPVRGWAWLELSAERKYPDMVAAADQLSALLDGAQRQAARRILEEELLPEYGDDVAIERTAKEMRRELRRGTGSRLGSRASLSAVTIIDGNGMTRRGDEFYDPAKWDFENIVRYETRLMFQLARGRVEAGELVIVEDEDQ